MTAVPPPGRVAAGAILAVALGLVALGALVLGARAFWVALFVVVGAVLLAGATAVSRTHLATGFVTLGVAASCWDAVRVGGASLFDVLATVGLLVVAIDAVLRRDAVRWPSGPLRFAVAGFALSAVLVALFPPDSFYVASRYLLPVMDLADVAVSSGDDGGGPSNLGGVGRLVVGMIVLPILVGWYARDWAAMRTVGRAFVGGAVLSAVAGLGDYAGVTDIGESLIGYAPAGSRVTGLTSQPNHLALTAVMALPFVWMLSRRRLVRIPLIVVLLVAILVSGSRAGLVGAAAALLICLVWRYRARFVLFSVPVGILLLLVGSALLSFTRFGSDSAAGSDLQRSQVFAQGLDDFRYSPLFGIGLRVSQDAHIIYLQLLASAGVIGLLSFGVLIVATLLAAWRLREQPVAVAAGVSVIAYLVVGTASNALLTRYSFVPVVIVMVAARYLAPRLQPPSRRRTVASCTVADDLHAPLAEIGTASLIRHPRSVSPGFRRRTRTR